MREADIHAAVRRIRDAVFWRVAHKSPGRSTDLYPVAVDFEKTKDSGLPVADHAAISAAGYVVDRKGWLARGRSVREVGREEGSLLSSPPPNLKIERGRSSSLGSLPSNVSEDEGESETKSNQTSPGLRLDLGNLAEGASPDKDSRPISGGC